MDTRSTAAQWFGYAVAAIVCAIILVILLKALWVVVTW